MFRIPSFAEVRDLFFRSHTVQSALGSLHRAADRLEHVMAATAKKIEQATNDRLDHLVEAERLAADIVKHQAEQAKASRVGQRIRDLLS